MSRQIIATLFVLLFSFNAFGAFSEDIFKTLLEEKLHCENSKKCSGIQSRMDHYHIPGISIALVQQGKIYTYTSGTQRKGTPSPIERDTLFQACSISKPFAAILALKLFKQYRLDLDENVNKYLKNWKVPDDDFTQAHPVTLRNILNHTAGFRGGRGYDFGLNDRIPSILEILKGEFSDHKALSKPAIQVEFKPGSKWQYSTTGYTVLQQLIEDISSAPFDDLGNDLLKKIQMKKSTFKQPLPNSLWSQAAHSHDEKGEPLHDDWRVNPQVAAAGLWTTPSDLAQFIIEMNKALTKNEKSVLESEIAEAMTLEYFENFGLGIRTGGPKNRKWFSHGGDNAGFKALLVGVPNENSGLVVMTNSDSGFSLTQEVLKTVATAFNWPEFKI